MSEPLTEILILKDAIRVYFELLPKDARSDAEMAVDSLIKALRQEAMRSSDAEAIYRRASKAVAQLRVTPTP